MFSRPEPRKSFRSIVADNLVATLSSAMAGQAPEKKGNNVLVVDDYALAILNAAVSQSDLVKVGFIAVCPFETKKQLADGRRRRPYPALDVLYFMQPKKKNLQRLMEDYKTDIVEEKKDIFERFLPCIFKGVPTSEPDPAMYADCRMLVLPGIRKVEKFRTPTNWQVAEAVLINAVETRGKELVQLSSSWQRDDTPTKECSCEVMAYEPNVFSLDTPDTLSIVYTHNLAAGVLEAEDLKAAQNKVYDHLDTVAYRLMTALVTLNEAPFIRYSSSPRGAAEIVARTLSKQLKVYRDEHPNFKPIGESNSSNNGGYGDDDYLGVAAGRNASANGRASGPSDPATVLILDRIDDLAPALIHDTSYTSLLIDLLGREPCTPFDFSYSTKAGKTINKEVMLDETDPVWRNVRYDDMGTVVEAIEDGVRACNAREDARAELDPSDMNDLRKMLAAITTDEKLVSEKFALHYRIKVQVMEEFERRRLHGLCTLEQLLATGCDSEGDKVNSKDVEKQMKTVLADNNIEVDDKIRLLILWIICAKSVDNKARDALISAAGLSQKDRSLLMNLQNFHVPVTRSANELKSDAAPFHDEETLKRNRKLAQETRKLCRYVSKAEDVVQYFLRGNLPEEQYPWIKAPPKGGRGGAGGAGGSGANGAGGSSASGAGVSSYAVAVQGHGEAGNKYTAKALSDVVGGDRKDVKNARTKQSKFKDGGDADGGSGSSSAAGGGGSGSGGSGGGSGKRSKEEELLSKYMEPPKMRMCEGARIIVFIVGGVTQAEITALERLSKESNREIVIGGTSLLTARDFVEQLAETEPPVDDDDIAGTGFPAMEDF